MFKMKNLLALAKKKNRTIVFPEAGFSDRTIEAVKYLHKKKIVKVILIGDESSIVVRHKELSGYTIINPKTSQLKEKFVKKILQKRKDKGLTQKEAEKLVLDPYYFATLLVDEGMADGMVGGAECSTATNIRPALQLIKAEKKNGIVSSFFFIYGKNKFLKNKSLILSDCAVMENPTAEQLVEIANQSVDSARIFQIDDPKLAFLSYSTKGSAKSDSAEKMKKANLMFKRPAVVSDGELQFDAAMVGNVAALKDPNGKLNGDANILIFPDINSGNICYKTMQYVGGLRAIGPILQGLKKPVNDLSRGCSVEDIIEIAAVTALQAKGSK